VARAATSMAEARGCSVTLLKAGRNNKDAIEDALAAGEILQAMSSYRLHGAAPPTSSVLESEFFSGESGVNLTALGYTKDLHFCAQVDLYDVVPTLVDGILVAKP
jgi:2-phosphosulfolactate phosphatase